MLGETPYPKPAQILRGSKMWPVTLDRGSSESTSGNATQNSRDSGRCSIWQTVEVWVSCCCDRDIKPLRLLPPLGARSLERECDLGLIELTRLMGFKTPRSTELDCRDLCSASGLRPDKTSTEVKSVCVGTEALRRQRETDSYCCHELGLAC